MVFEENSQIDNFINDVRQRIKEQIDRIEEALKATRNNVAERKFKNFKILLQKALDEQAGVTKAQKKPLRHETCPNCFQPLSRGVMVAYDKDGNGTCMACKTPVT